MRTQGRRLLVRLTAALARNCLGRCARLLLPTLSDIENRRASGRPTNSRIQTRLKACVMGVTASGRTPTRHVHFFHAGQNGARRSVLPRCAGEEDPR